MREYTFKMEQEDALIQGTVTVCYECLPIEASFIGMDSYFEYWQGVDGNIYAL